MARLRGRGRLVLAAFAAVAVGLVAATVYSVVGGNAPFGPQPLVIKADFVEAPGLYVGSNVDILGVAVGKINKITPNGSDVVVEMSVKPGIHVPGNAIAALLSPTVVSDRVVELAPAYTGGPQMESGGEIPTSRTRTPVEVDKIFSSVDALVKALGSNSANHTGSLADLLHVTAQNFAGNGQNLSNTIKALAQALPAVSSNDAQLTTLLKNLDSLSRALADHDSTVSAFYSDLAGASTELAGERSDLAAALSNLQVVLGQLATFVAQNHQAASADVKNLVTITNALLAHQQALIETIDVTPLALGNFAGTIDSSYPGGPVLRVRLDDLPGTLAVVQQFCGSSGTPHAVKLAAKTGTTFDLLCAALFALTQEPPPPGSPQNPNLGLQQFLGAAP
jgi:phospholipid/cholesterol/gamma-HCH transport system substrate-binding protein